MCTGCTELVQSLASALKYVYNKTAYFLLRTVYNNPITEDGLPEKPEFKHPNVLEQSILEMYKESPLSQSQHIRSIGIEPYEQYLKIVGTDLSQGPGNVMLFYQMEHFNDGSLVKLYDYPGLNDLI